MELRPFQRLFLRKVQESDIKVAVLSCARANGKSTLCGYLLSRIMNPDDDLFESGTENVITAASLTQCRIVYRVCRKLLVEKGIEDQYSWQDSSQRIAITHKKTNTKVIAHSSTGKTLFGLLDTRYLILDEPGALEIAAGEMLWSAVKTSLGKMDSPLTVILIGHKAPRATRSGHWYYDLIEGGSQGSTWVQHYQGDSGNWDSWESIRKANPLLFKNPELAKQLKEEREKARRDERLKAEFMSYRLNIPSRTESEVLLRVCDWQRVIGRPVAERKGRPIVGIDIGASRAWSAATAIWQSGRVESLALTPGIPSIEEQERRDNVPSGTYASLGNLYVSEGKHVPPVGDLWEAVTERWGTPARVVCDRLRLGELRDCIPPSVFVEVRKGLWSEATQDIRSLRRVAADGPLSIAPDSRSLVEASLAASMVENDTSGNTRLRKRGTNNQARDDVAAAWVLAAGAYERASRVQTKPLKTAIVR